MFRFLTTAALLAAPPALAQDATMLELRPTEEYGPVLALSNGRPVYTFATDVPAGDGQTPLASCNEPCREIWPLVTTSGEPGVGEGLDPELLSTIEWEGQTVVQYASQPLFLYIRDEPGLEPQGQVISTFGGWWYLLDAAGNAIVTGIAPDPNDPADHAPESSQPGTAG